MMINRNNYEEFFMLYADGELSAADRQAVELFAGENADLSEELDLYLQTRLPDEPVVFGDKRSLLRFEAEEINASNCEEQFLLYVDNELDAAGREKTERFVLQHPAFQAAFTLLKQTRLPEETIVFREKASLYRKEDKKRPVLYMQWGRMAAAAVFIGLAIAVWMFLPKQHPATQNLAQAATGSITEKHPVATPTEGEQSLTAAATGNNPATGSRSAAGASYNAPQLPVTVSGVQQEPAQADNNLVAVNTVNPPADQKMETVGSTHTSTESIGVTTGSFNDEPAHNAMLVNSTKHADEEATENNAHPAVYKELDTDDEKKSLYLGSLEINKDKLRGFFRKAGSIFRSKARQEEDDNNKTESAPRSRSLK